MLYYIIPLLPNREIMKKESNIKSQILNTGDDRKIIIIRLIVGLIFISEGIQKFVIVTAFGPAFFKDIGFTHPLFWTYFTGAFEISCGVLILFGLLTRLASIPLLIIMITAFITTKLPLLSFKGIWTFLHEYSIDFSLTLQLILLIIFGGGKWSVDLKFLRSKNP
jgi:putative oxidoreductase